MQRGPTATVRPALSAPIRALLLASGVGLVGLGILGHFLPVMPSTIFYILALYCFKRSSPRLERRLLEHPVIGPTLREWDEHRGMRLRTKKIAISMLWVGLIASMLIVQKPYVIAILVATGVILTWYMASRPTIPVAMDDQSHRSAKMAATASNRASSV